MTKEEQDKFLESIAIELDKIILDRHLELYTNTPYSHLEIRYKLIAQSDRNAESQLGREIKGMS
jgi:hypothetical protein